VVVPEVYRQLTAVLELVVVVVVEVITWGQGAEVAVRVGQVSPASGQLRIMCQAVPLAVGTDHQVVVGVWAADILTVTFCLGMVG
jgi:hypothetical protein